MQSVLFFRRLLLNSKVFLIVISEFSALILRSESLGRQNRGPVMMPERTVELLNESLGRPNRRAEADDGV
jgi:hypothetical protein